MDIEIPSRVTRTDELIDAAKNELAAISKGGIDDSLFDRAFEIEKTETISESLSNRWWTDRICTTLMTSGSLDRINEWVSDLSMISKDDIAELVSKVIRPDKLHQVSLKPSSWH